MPKAMRQPTVDREQDVSSQQRGERAEDRAIQNDHDEQVHRPANAELGNEIVDRRYGIAGEYSRTTPETVTTAGHAQEDPEAVAKPSLTLPAMKMAS